MPVQGPIWQCVGGGRQAWARQDVKARRRSLRAHLVLPLPGQHLAVDARDLDARGEASAVVRLDDEAAKGIVRADGCGGGG